MAKIKGLEKAMSLKDNYVKTLVKALKEVIG